MPSRARTAMVRAGAGDSTVREVRRASLMRAAGKLARIDTEQPPCRRKQAPKARGRDRRRPHAARARLPAPPSCNWCRRCATIRPATPRSISRSRCCNPARAPSLPATAGRWSAICAPSAANGCRWRPIPFNPLRIRGNARRLAQLIASERIDIVHAHERRRRLERHRRHRRACRCSWSPRSPTGCAANSWPGTLFGRSLARGDRVIAPSAYVARMMIERYKIAPERITVIPRAVDTVSFSPAAVERRPHRGAAPVVGNSAARCAWCWFPAASRRGTDS